MCTSLCCCGGTIGYFALGGMYLLTFPLSLHVSFSAFLFCFSPRCNSLSTLVKYALLHFSFFSVISHQRYCYICICVNLLLHTPLDFSHSSGLYGFFHAAVSRTVLVVIHSFYLYVFFYFIITLFHSISIHFIFSLHTSLDLIHAAVDVYVFSCYAFIYLIFILTSLYVSCAGYGICCTQHTYYMLTLFPYQLCKFL